ncbi:predicted protein [Verticillium alfalfae VaMs.102]|uniref:Predicted protein n=1 Tax=Verticillium alfalfae (strain VaMs.102 / ATCC MYA-4576 / FGSC 10136) TaxID=526221 RepID=C9SJB4_VERA1|nr:predicted protein [Verticillium alfalfae VaMs.102]EEY18276.1 predicted protein [Verticillium alfalfae VaMs.102]
MGHKMHPQPQARNKICVFGVGPDLSTTDAADAQAPGAMSKLTWYPASKRRYGDKAQSERRSVLFRTGACLPWPVLGNAKPKFGLDMQQYEKDKLKGVHFRESCVSRTR